MRYRTTTLLARQAMPAGAGTFIIDIPITDIISAFRFHLELQTDATVKLAHGFDAVSKIQIVDGSDVLLDISAAQMDAIHFFERGKLGNITCQDFASALDEFYTAIYFGRFPFDPELALNPRMFTNPQMRITYNGATYNAGVGTGDVFLTILADVFDEYVPSPIGFLQHREFYRYTPAGGAFHYVDLPTDLVIRKLIVQPHMYAWQPIQSFAAARLDEDNMKRIPFDLLYEDWLAMNRQEYGPAEHGVAASRQGINTPLFHGIASWPVFVWGELAAPILWTIGVNGCQLLCTDGVSDDSTFIGRMTGHCPHFCLCYPFGDQKNIADWYDTAEIGNLRLRLLASALPVVGTTHRVILQQMRRY